jgi:hypothetical protein
VHVRPHRRERHEPPECAHVATTGFDVGERAQQHGEREIGRHVRPRERMGQQRHVRDRHEKERRERARTGAHDVAVEDEGNGRVREHAHRRHERQSGHALAGRRHELEEPIVVDPGSSRRREGEDVDARHRPGREHLPPRLQVPADAGIAERIARPHERHDDVEDEEHRAEVRREPATSPAR